MKSIELLAPAVAALSSVLANAQVAPDRRGTIKRIQKQLEANMDGMQCHSGTVELETADWEWLEKQAAVTTYPGQIVLVDGDEQLRAAITEVLTEKDGSDGTKA